MTVAPWLQLVALYAALTLLSAGVVWAMTFIGNLDVPGERSSHSEATPKGGGVGIVLASLIGVGLTHRLSFSPAYGWVAMLAGAGLALFSYFDDRESWPALSKLALQVMAALMVVTGGLALNLFGLDSLTIKYSTWIEGLLATLYILYLMNALNFIDGLNGLASGVAGIACGAVALNGLAFGSSMSWAIALPLLAGLIGFLPFNFPKARIFMGDVGSQFCGLQLAVLTLYPSQASSPWYSLMLVPLALNAVLFDVGFTLLRRFIAGEHLLKAHREHLYQIAQRCRLTSVEVTLLHWTFAIWGVCWYAAASQASMGFQFASIGIVLSSQVIWLYTVRRWCMAAGYSLLNF